MGWRISPGFECDIVMRRCRAGQDEMHDQLEAPWWQSHQFLWFGCMCFYELSFPVAQMDPKFLRNQVCPLAAQLLLLREILCTPTQCTA